MEVYPDMRKIKRWKQGIAVAGVIALTGSLLAGCGGADGKNSGSKGETGSINQAGNADTADLVNVNTDNSDGKKTKDESAKAMGRFLENDLTVPENSQFLRDVKVLDSGALRMVYYSTADNCYYAADSADNGETWTNGKSLSRNTIECIERKVIQDEKGTDILSWRGCRRCGDLYSHEKKA